MYSDVKLDRALLAALWFTGVAIGTLGGCGRTAEVPSIQISEPVILSGDELRPFEAPPPKIQIVEPRPGVLIKSGDQLICNIKVEAVPPGRLPESVHIMFQRGEKPAGGGMAAFVKRRAETCVELVVTVEVPKTPGKYSLVAEGTETMFTQVGKPGVRPKRQKRLTRSAPIAFVVGDLK